MTKPLTASVEKTEVINTMRFAHSVAPTDASKGQAITTNVGQTDARNDEQGRDQETA